jgi:LPS O-antigen subunit length determinant protein (WzzB/FepE family)
MSEETRQSEPINIVTENEGEIDLLQLARVLWKGKKLIIWIVVIFAFPIAYFLKRQSGGKISSSSNKYIS